MSMASTATATGLHASSDARTLSGVSDATMRRCRSTRSYGMDVTAESARDAIRAFVAERDWEQFHTPENLAKSIAIEAGELLERFQWGEPAQADGVADELADVLTYCLLLADRLGVDPDEIILSKLEQTRVKYPVEKARGRSEKYDRL